MGRTNLDYKSDKLKKGAFYEVIINVRKSN